MIPPNLSVKSFEGFDVNNMFLGTAFKASPLIPKSVGGNNSNSWTVSHIHPPASNKLKPNIPRAVTDIGTLSGIQTSSINTIVKGVLPGSSVGLEISSTAGSRIDSISSISLQDISVTSSIGNDAITRVMATSSKAATTKTSSRTSVSATTINPASVNSNSSSMMNSESRLKEASAISANSWYISGPISYHGVYNSTKIASEVRLFPRQNSAASQNPAATAVAAEEQVHTVQQSILTRKHPHSNSGAIQPATITRATLQKWKSFNLNKNSNPSPPSNISTYESTAAILNAVNLPKEFRHSNTKSGYFSSLELPSPTYPNGYTMGLEEQNQLISTLTRENSASSMRPLTASKRRQALRMGLENSRKCKSRRFCFVFSCLSDPLTSWFYL